MSNTKITVHGDYNKIVHTLSKHIGPLLHSLPIVFWHGDGWHMKIKRDTEGNIAYEIEFVRDYDSTVFMLML